MKDTNGGKLIGYKNKEDNDKFTFLAQGKLSDNYTAKQAIGIYPKVRLVGLSSQQSGENICEHIKKCNANIFTDADHFKVLKINPFQ